MGKLWEYLGIHTGDLLSDGKRESFNEILLVITAIIGTKLRPFLPTNVLVVIHLASRLQQPHVGNMGEVVSCWVYCPTSLIMLGQPSKATINHPYFDGLYRPFMVNLNMVYYCFTNIKILSIIAPHGKHQWMVPASERNKRLMNFS